MRLAFFDRIEEIVSTLLSTGKSHISFSEIKTWRECSYRHRLTHIEKIKLSTNSPVLSFGTAIHAACESFLKTRVMNDNIFIEKLKSEWSENVDIPAFTQEEFDENIKTGKAILSEIPATFDKEFPEWEFIDAEHMLNESIDGQEITFKGFIDGIIRYKHKNKIIYYILDWKTSNFGWFRTKLMDTNTTSQVVFYKHFWAKKMNVPLKEIKCGYIVLSKQAKNGNRINIITISAGETTINKSLVVIKNMVATLNRGIAIKNKSNCTWCEYKNTEYCTLHYFLSIIVFITMNKKNTILMLSDHPLSTSGVGTQSRWLIEGLIKTGNYSFKCLGGAVKHDDYNVKVVNDDFIIMPTDGFGDKNLVRKILATVKPDALLLFTDPRFFTWVWEMADEIQQVCPITYWHLWDNGPNPIFNYPLYESTDLINCINYPTYQMIKENFPEKVNYIPHAVPSDIYCPIPDEKIREIRMQVLGHHRVDHFVPLFVARNARRKMPSDILASWKDFIDWLYCEEGHKKATLLMHCDPLDSEGTNLFKVVDLFNLKDNVAFSGDKIPFEKINTLYGISDCVVNRSCAEGFGLPVLEGLMCGKPAIAIKTGGLTRQIFDSDTNEQFGIALEPEVKTLIGNHVVPYIYEDFVSNKTFTNAFIEMYKMGNEERKSLGAKGRVRALQEYNLQYMISKWDETLQNTIKNHKKSGSSNRIAVKEII